MPNGANEVALTQWWCECAELLGIDAEWTIGQWDAMA